MLSDEQVVKQVMRLVAIYKGVISGIHEPCGYPHGFGEQCFDEWLSRVVANALKTRDKPNERDEAVARLVKAATGAFIQLEGWANDCGKDAKILARTMDQLRAALAAFDEKETG